LREFKAEKQIAEQQKDIAKKELDRVITESVNTKKKLETIMIQRSKDAKDLSAMRHIKDKTVQVCACEDVAVGGCGFLLPCVLIT